MLNLQVGPEECNGNDEEEGIVAEDNVDAAETSPVLEAVTQTNEVGDEAAHSMPVVNDNNNEAHVEPVDAATATAVHEFDFAVANDAQVAAAVRNTVLVDENGELDNSSDLF